jgi:shikimate dehydrogenase
LIKLTSSYNLSEHNETIYRLRPPKDKSVAEASVSAQFLEHAVTIVPGIHPGLPGGLDTARKQAADGGVLIGLVGRGIGSSRSPVMHQREGARLGMQYAYNLIDFDQLGLENRALNDIVTAAEHGGFAGLNITHPFKQSVLPLLTDLSPEAAAIGAVNTVVFDSGRRIGHNTDAWGFAESFRENMAECDLTNVLQFGAGGGGAAVAYALLSLGTDHLWLHDITGSRAAALAIALNRQFGDKVHVVSDEAAAFAATTGIVNATPIGMAKYPGIPFEADLLRKAHWVAEIIYFPLETELLRQARKLGCRTLSGIGMAVYQAVRAFELFTGVRPDRTEMRRHFEEGGNSA